MTREMWWKEFVKVMRKMPPSVELVVDGGADGGRVEMYPAGTLRAHLDRDTGFGMAETGLASSLRCRILPYSEGA